jgi:DNA-binding XRE family transcriptional regulator
MPTPRTKPVLTPEQEARLAAIKRKAAADRAAGVDGPPAPDVDWGDGVQYAIALRAGVARLKAAREAAGMTAAAVAEASGVTPETISRLETGVLRNPTWQTLAGYAVAVGCRLSLGVEPA